MATNAQDFETFVRAEAQATLAKLKANIATIADKAKQLRRAEASIDSPDAADVALDAQVADAADALTTAMEESVSSFLAAAQSAEAADDVATTDAVAPHRADGGFSDFWQKETGLMAAMGAVMAGLL